MLNLEKTIAKFTDIVSQNHCAILAKKTQFVCRSTSQIKGHEFAQAMMLPHAFVGAETLNSLAVRMREINQKCNLSAPALAQRINTKEAKNFMKACFAKVLKEVIKKDFDKLSDLQNLSFCKRILIEDSTKAELHEKLGENFKGTGGAASKASVKIDYIFDYMSEQFVHIKFFSGNHPDQSLAPLVEPILQKNDLVIRDLGYFSIGGLKTIARRKAYYISRFKIDLVVYKNKEDQEPLDLAKFLARRACQGVIDEQVFIGREKYAVRLVGCRMPEEAINKRLREAYRYAQRHGTKISKRKSRLLCYSIFVTNVPETLLSGIFVMTTYRARWRIELIFKQWKSCLNLHLFKGYNPERFHCFLYGRLIMILLLGALFPPLMQYAFTIGLELSFYKLIKYLISDHAFARAFQGNTMEQFINQLLEDIPGRLCMDRRKQPSLRSNVRNGNCYCNELKIMELQKNVA